MSEPSEFGHLRGYELDKVIPRIAFLLLVDGLLAGL